MTAVSVDSEKLVGLLTVALGEETAAVVLAEIKVEPDPDVVVIEMPRPLAEKWARMRGHSTDYGAATSQLCFEAIWGPGYTYR